MSGNDWPVRVIEAGGPAHFQASQAAILHAAILDGDWRVVRLIGEDPYTDPADRETAREALSGAGYPDLGPLGLEVIKAARALVNGYRSGLADLFGDAAQVDKGALSSLAERVAALDAGLDRHRELNATPNNWVSGTWGQVSVGDDVRLSGVIAHVTAKVRLTPVGSDREVIRVALKIDGQDEGHYTMPPAGPIEINKWYADTAQVFRDAGFEVTQ